jgi:hydroxymethylpyrimidine/phosphomethylpyrimidine kinase
VRRVLAIGGSDSGGGAGIQADLKTLHGLGVHASTVVTAVTAQSTRAVEGVWEVPPDAVEAQLRAILDDIGADVVKTGMLPSAAAVELVAQVVGGLPLVVDPVGVSSSGHRLASREALEAMRRVLLPLSLVVTPNLAEVESLTGVRVTDAAGLQEAAEAVHALGPAWVLVTGGHLIGEAVDLLFDGSTSYALPGARIATENDHGSGCTFAAALAGFLALGDSVPVAARLAKELVADALRRGYPLGSGPGPVRQGPAPVRPAPGTP